MWNGDFFVDIPTVDCLEPEKQHYVVDIWSGNDRASRFFTENTRHKERTFETLIEHWKTVAFGIKGYAESPGIVWLSQMWLSGKGVDI